MDLNKRDLPDHGVAPEGANNNPPPPKKNFLTYVMIFFVVPVMAIIESAKGLFKRVYERDFFGGSALLVIGILLSLGAGIGTGYYEGWVNDWSWYAWLPASLAATLGTFFYGWPLAWLGIVKPVHTASKELWDAVPRRNQWFTDFLKLISRIAVLGGSAWFGWQQGSAALANLTSHGWGIFAYAGAFAWFCIVGLIAAAFLWSIFTTTIYGVAVGSGLLLSWTLMPLTQSWLAHFGLTAPGWGFAATALEFVVYVAFLFPLVHVMASHGLRYVKDLARKVYNSAYEKTIGEYEGVFTQLVNIWTAYHLATLTLTLFAALGFALSGWLFWAVPSAVALLSYLLVGQVFRAVGNKGLGVVAAAHGARWAVYALAGLSLPWLLAGTALAAALTFFVVYPVAYVLVRLIGQFILNNKVAAVLVTAHDKACDAAEQLVKEVARARKNTYGDESWFSKMFLHLANLAVLVPVWFYATGFLGAVGMTGWVSWLFTGLALVLSYLLIGRLLAASKNYLVGGLAALVGAVATGVLTYAHLPLAAQGWAMWIAIPAAIVGGLLVAGWLFPVAYVCARFLVTLVDGFVPFFTKVLEPVVRNVHEFCWGKARGLWLQFRDTYRMVRAWFKPIWADISKAWSDAWQSVKDTWESVKGGRR